MPEAPLPSRARAAAGWTAVALSTAVSSFWAFWGSIENFHEGWYERSLWLNVRLMLVQYIPWMFIPMGAGLLALWHRGAGVAAHLTLALGAVRLFGLRSPGFTLIALPVTVLGLLHAYGRPRPLAWARRALVAIPLLTALASGAYPAWRVFTRPDRVETSMQRIRGNGGVNLVWAPAGPGWNERGITWFEAKRRCDHLTADGMALAAEPQHVWRLPATAEAVQTMIWRGRNAGGRWDPQTGRASYDATPDKEAPLWHPYSDVIYWWTADEADARRAYRIAYNGYVLAIAKQQRPGYLSCRCVKER